MSKHPREQGNGAGHAPSPDTTFSGVGSDVSSDVEHPLGVSSVVVSSVAVSSVAVLSTAEHSHAEHSHAEHSHAERSHAEHSHAEHSHHHHAGEGAQARREPAPTVDPVACGARVPCIVIVDDDVELSAGISLTIGAACRTHCVTPAGAVALLQRLPAVDVALVDCDPPPSVQAPIFGELARWPAAICVLMSANTQKVEQFRALGVFAPLVLDKPVHPEALEAIRSATLELCRALG